MLNAVLLPFALVAALLLGRLVFGPRAGDPALSERGLRLRKRLRLGGIAVLAAGLAAAGCIALCADPAPPSGDRVLRYEMGPLGAEPVLMRYSKKDNSALEKMGGKALIFSNDLSDWFDDLWRGRELATTVAAGALIASFACFYLARYVPMNLDAATASPSGQE